MTLLKKDLDQFADRAPYWDSPDKVRMAESFVEEVLRHVTPQGAWRGLEIGAGTGLVGLQLLPMIDSLVCVDTSESMLQALRSKTAGKPQVEVLHGATEEYNRRDIDFVFSNMSFHHIDDIEALLAHLSEITRPGAWLAVGDLCREDGSFHNHNPIPHQGFDRQELGELFEKAGFRVVSNETYRTLKRKREDGGEKRYEQFALIAQKS